MHWFTKLDYGGLLWVPYLGGEEKFVFSPQETICHTIGNSTCEKSSITQSPRENYSHSSVLTTHC